VMPALRRAGRDRSQAQRADGAVAHRVSPATNAARAASGTGSGSNRR
jgi:hypothetical protein